MGKRIRPLGPRTGFRAAGWPEYYYKPAEWSCQNSSSPVWDKVSEAWPGSYSDLGNKSVPALKQYIDPLCREEHFTGLVLNTTECLDFLMSTDEKIIEKFRMDCVVII